MAEDFIFADSPEYVWADLPGAEFADSTGTSSVVRLCRPRLVNLSTHYRCKSIKGGRIMSNAIETIRIGHGGTILVQLQAENMETGITAPLPEVVMNTISRIQLVLASGVVIDSSTTGVGLGAGLPFDHTIDPAAAKLAVTVGGITQIVGMEGHYTCPHFDIYFGGELPIYFAAPEIKIIPAD